MTMEHFILNGHEPVVEPDLLTWARWFETANRSVALDTPVEGVRVSTVFLGLDHGFGLSPGPLLFETMVFGGPHDDYCERYATWDEAEAGHRLAVELVKQGEAALAPAPRED